MCCLQKYAVMILFKKKNDLHKWLENQRRQHHSIGFVPTMGALHEGHTSLIRSSKNVNSITCCSIFVNPAQFNNKTDFEKYPSTIERDIEKLLDAQNDVLFLPSIDEIYPQGFQDQIFDLGYLDTILEGKHRPGHFQGVCKVVKRLLEIVQPDELYLGQKDYQQCMVIKKLVELMGHEEKIRIRINPTIREGDGLAMSSRNMRLNPDERKQATTIYQALQFIRKNIEPGDLSLLKTQANSLLENAGFKVDYVDIADGNTLETVNNWNGSQSLVALIAAYLNEIRLIDNLVLDSNE
jgi:pantoate--beta-alanine ligase